MAELKSAFFLKGISRMVNLQAIYKGTESLLHVPKKKLQWHFKNIGT